MSLLTLVQVLRALDKLEVLNVFKAYQIESPIKLLKEEEKKRKRAVIIFASKLIFYYVFANIL